MELLETIDPEGVSDEELDGYDRRVAARAVVFDDDGNVALLHVTKLSYHKLPGGGVEEGEDVRVALQRECEEEIGCNVDIEEEVGEIIEHRKQQQLIQESHTYLATVIGEKGEPNFTDEEAATGFEIMWVPLKDAIDIISDDDPDVYEGMFIIARDLIFLKEAQRLRS